MQCSSKTGYCEKGKIIIIKITLRSVSRSTTNECLRKNRLKVTITTTVDPDKLVRQSEAKSDFKTVREILILLTT